MSAIALVGLVSVALNQEQLKKLLLPLVAFSAGSLLGGALLHLLPEAVAASGPGLGTFLPALGGFALFFLMEQFLSWLGDHVTIGLGTVVGIGVEAGDRCQVGALSFVPKFSRLNADTTYVGTPVRELQPSEERAIVEDVH